MIMDFMTEFVGIPVEEFADPIVQSYAFLSGMVLGCFALCGLGCFLMSLFNIKRR